MAVSALCIVVAIGTTVRITGCSISTAITPVRIRTRTSASARLYVWLYGRNDFEVHIYG